MLRTTFGSLRTLLPSSSGRPAAILVVASVFAGVLEAALLVLVVNAAVALTGELQGITLSLPVIGVLRFTPSGGLLAAGAFGLVVIGLHMSIAWLTADLAAATLAAARSRSIRAFSSAAWCRQSAVREGSVQEMVGTLSLRTSSLIMSMSQLASGAIALVCLIGASLIVDAYVTVFVVVVGALMFLILAPIGRATRRRARDFIQRNHELGERVAQWTGIAMELRVFGVARTEAERLNAESEATAGAFRKSRFLTQAGSLAYRDIAILFLVGATGVLYLSDGVNVASVGSVVLLVVRSLSYAQTTNSALQSLNENNANLGILLQQVASLEEEREKEGNSDLGAVSGISIQGVSHEYEVGRVGLQGLSIDVSPGEAIGVVGPSGAGKSTLVEVLMRLRLPTSGRIEVSGVPYEQIAEASWRNLVALVPQTPRLFEGTVAENIRFMRDGIADSAVRKAAEDAHILDEILRLPDEFETMLGPRGAGLSGGQRQRLAIARALVGSPQVLVLDEPTSALDVKSEALLQETIAALQGRVTLVIVAHRFRTLQSCDRIVSLDDGGVKVIGTLEDALATVSFVDTGAPPS